jgi:hypothetical protein
MIWHRSNEFLDRGENPTRGRAYNNDYSSLRVEAGNHDANNHCDQGQEAIRKIEVGRRAERPQHDEGQRKKPPKAPSDGKRKSAGTQACGNEHGAGDAK